MTPLYNHTSPETAYLVEDYPYGFRLRCKIRYWIEYKAPHGFRFCSQTTNPKRGDIWNKPKCSTYTEFAAAMYLDAESHVQWRGVGAYTDGDQALEFVRAFPQADLKLLRVFARAKVAYLEKTIAGEAYWTINGVRQPYTDDDRAKDLARLETWKAVVNAPA